MAIVTGGAGGIGRAIGRALTGRGIRCVLADRDAAALERATAELGPLTEGFVIDVTEFGRLGELIDFVLDRHGRLDILVNNAGITSTEDFATRPLDSIRREMDINLMAPILLTRLAFAALVRSGDGRVINTVSLGGIFPLPETSIYSASKFGLRGLNMCLHLYGRPLGVQVGAIMPSATETPMLIREAVEGGNKMQFMDPPQQPRDVARQILAMLDKPCMERYPRLSESLLVRAVMTAPNLVHRLLPLFRKRAEKGFERYIATLETRGLVVRRDGRLEMT